jgi:hypothetical protein
LKPKQHLSVIATLSTHSSHARSAGCTNGWARAALLAELALQLGEESSKGWELLSLELSNLSNGGSELLLENVVHPICVRHSKTNLPSVELHWGGNGQAKDGEDSDSGELHFDLNNELICWWK